MSLRLFSRYCVVHSKFRAGRMALLGKMSPAYFGMVMATGIVSLAADMMGMASVAQVLFRLNIALYGGLWVLTLARAVCYPRLFFGDMVNHVDSWGFFTIVAASGILGGQFLVLAADGSTAWALWIVSLFRRA